MKPWEIYLSKVEHRFSGLDPSTQFELMGKARDVLKEQYPLFIDMSYSQLLKNVGPEKEFAQRLANQANISLQDHPPTESTAKKWGRRFLIANLILVAIFFVLYKIYSPLVDFDPVNNKLRLFGGAIEMDAVFDEYTITDFNGKTYRKKRDDSRWGLISGNIDPLSAKIQKLRVVMDSGKLNIETQPSSELSWKCRTQTKDSPEPKTQIIEGRLEVEFLNIKVRDCKFQIPEDIAVSTRVKSGRIEVDRPLFDVNLVLGSGSIFFRPDRSVEYNYMLDILSGSHGRTPRPPRNPRKIHRVKIHLDSGRVSFRRR